MICGDFLVGAESGWKMAKRSKEGVRMYKRIRENEKRANER